MGSTKGGTKAEPYINVTPLIDVLLVLLIIFMVIQPLKPTRFKALVPEKSEELQQEARFVRELELHHLLRAHARLRHEIGARPRRLRRPRHRAHAQPEARRLRPAGGALDQRDERRRAVE